MFSNGNFHIFKQFVGSIIYTLKASGESRLVGSTLSRQLWELEPQSEAR